ncbi:carbohydrate ABC transporter permease [Brachybacterium sacelli]|uniref:Raffinose/stachyose/melibiose transport system permease protein n=1 Tax=Brachybacterium sacelli TaxID=173364 RepID=A0ABS4WXW2_9MICO|nr:carbohydrate ABC transporter permease [Brachybacterium sacelli]MBP2380986.1 raffinose/stachyose/melibiose transport system permease protein [Brachybacterium sacelli]
MNRNWLGGTLGWLWLIVVLLPIYFVLITSFKSMAAYFGSNPVVPALPPVIENFIAVLEADFGMYLLNSVVVAVGTVVPLVIMAFMASYSIVRGSRRVFNPVRNLFLLGLAIPVQATIVPIYLLIIRMHMYDSLAALMLPAIAFGLPLSILIIANSLRDVPKELFEAMDIDGCTEWQKMWRLALPMTRPALVTVAVYQALLSWNGFLFPLILTQSPDKRTLPLALWSFQGEYATNIPVVMAAVTLSSIPIVVLYAVGRRYLVSGMTAGAGK